MINYIFYQAVSPMGVFPAGPSCANTFAWSEKRKAGF